MDYTIAMNFISWSMAIILATGYLYIKACVWFQDSPKVPTIAKYTMRILIAEYDCRDWSGRLLFVMMLGALAISNLIFLPWNMRKNKGE